MSTFDEAKFMEMAIRHNKKIVVVDSDTTAFFVLASAFKNKKHAACLHTQIDKNGWAMYLQISDDPLPGCLCDLCE